MYDVYNENNFPQEVYDLIEKHSVDFDEFQGEWNLLDVDQSSQERLS